MHARDTAIGFYEKYGYKVKGEQFIELNIPHHIMEKRLR
jgi:predicted GNAT family N-acyltransferase